LKNGLAYEYILTARAKRSAFSKPLVGGFLGEDPSSTRPPIAPYLVFLILIAATVPWRRNNYFEGTFDFVVLAKAVLSLMGLMIAVVLRVGRSRRPVPASSSVFLMLYVVCTLLGSWGLASAMASAIIALRVVILAAAIITLSTIYEGYRLVASLVMALGTYAVVGAITGLANLESGRLSGGFPPLHPNELASMAAVVAIYCFWKIIIGNDKLTHVISMLLALLCLYAAGSRTAMAALAVSSLLLLAHMRALRPRTLLILLLVVPGALWLLLSKNLLFSLLYRNQGTDELVTLSNRTIAWHAALSPQESQWHQWLGHGLARKIIEVSGQWWRYQVLDSSWISTLVQGGIIGLVLCVVWILHSLRRVSHAEPLLRGLFRAVILYFALRGLLESGLFDASVSFLVLFTTMLATPVYAVPDEGER
jgi:hypothetical protein